MTDSQAERLIAVLEDIKKSQQQTIIEFVAIVEALTGIPKKQPEPTPTEGSQPE